MKTSVRFLSMLLAILMIAGAALTASAAETEAKANSEALQLLVDLGVFGGYDDGSLKPDQLVERDEMAKIIFVLYTTFSDAGAGVVSFKDVKADNWAAGYISWCSSKGIVGGYGDGNFGPDDHVTYDQALKMVCGALGYNDWDSKLWPVDVRMKALTDLKLGENITGVAGSDYVTRAQIAQIVYNALFANMNETKTIEQKLPGTQISFPVEQSKTLAVDVWNFEETYAAVLGTSNIGFEEVTDEDKDIYLSELGEFSLEELGLEAYEKDVDDLLFATVRLISKKANQFDIDNVLATSVTLAGYKDVAITYDEKNDKFFIGEEEADEDATVLSVLGNTFAAAPLSGDTIPEEDSLYTSIAYDFDEDGKYDTVYWEYYAAVEVVATTAKKTTFTLYGETNNFTVLAEDIESNVAFEEGDVLVAVYDFNTLVIKQKVEPVAAKATKYNETKLTLDGVGEVKINEYVFVPNLKCTITDAVMDLNEKGDTTAYNYYIYEGKVFGSDVIVDESDLQFAVLSYVNQPKDAEYNEVTKEYDVAYTAVVNIDGKEKLIDLVAIDNYTMADNSDDILALYGKVYTNDGITEAENGKYLLNHYVLVTYTVDEDGKYTLKTNATSEDYTVYPANSTLTYNNKTGFYTIENEAGVRQTAKAVLADASSFYYTYQKETTGNYTYLGQYTTDTLPEGFKKAVTTAPIYAIADEETGIVEIKFTMIDNESIEIEKEAVADFRTDARQIFYCYQNSNQVMAEDKQNLNYSYFMRPIYNGSNLAEKVNTELTAAQGAINAVKGHLYAWDEETKNYVKVSKSSLEELGVTSVGMYVLSEIVNGCIITEDGKYIEGAKLAPDVSIWALGGTDTSFATLDIEGVKKSLIIAEEGGYTTKCIVGTALNSEGKEEIKVLIIQQYVYNSAGEPAPNTTTLITNFAG